MSDAISNVYKKYRLNKDQIDEIYAQNRKILKGIYLFSFFFGVTFLIVKLLSNDAMLTDWKYYVAYIFIGSVGYILGKIKKIHYTSTILALVAFCCILIYYLLKTPDVANVFVLFAGLSFALIILLNFNPFLFMGLILTSEIIMVILMFTKVNMNHIYRETVLIPNALLLNALIMYLVFWKRKSIIKKYDIEQQIKQEKEKSEELLLNILPYNVMTELRDNGKSIPKSFENTTVLYCSITNFHELSQKMNADSFIKLLNKVFDAFDLIIEKESCYRIKTTGNVYMAICGLPVPDENHAEKMVICSRKFVEYIKDLNEKSDVKINIRIGLHSGKVVAGIVGTQKYIYDVFGDTVNTACRMQTLTDGMKVRVTELTHDLVKEKFPFASQPATMVKGKGMMNTYILSDQEDPN
jgi:class 3 adenylate cyclase